MTRPHEPTPDEARVIAENVMRLIGPIPPLYRPWERALVNWVIRRACRRAVRQPAIQAYVADAITAGRHREKTRVLALLDGTERTASLGKRDGPAHLAATASGEIRRLAALITAAHARGRAAALAEAVDVAERMRQLLVRFIRANDDAPGYGMCDQRDNDGEWYQSAGLAALLIDARGAAFTDPAIRALIPTEPDGGQ